MHDLMSGQDPGRVGGPAQPLPPAAAADVAPKGFGALTSLVQFQPEITEYGVDPRLARKLSRSPHVMTAAVYGVGGPGAGPLVGVARFGSGNGLQQVVEFDIPTPTPNPASSNVTSGGLLVTVPGTSLEIAARNDANLLPRAGDTPLGATVNTPQGTASIALGTRPSTSQLTRTIYAVNLPTGAPFVPTNTALIGIPAFAQRVRLFRTPATAALSIEFLGVTGIFAVNSGPYNDPVSAAPPVYVIPNGSQIVRITNLGPGNIDVCGAVFELGL